MVAQVQQNALETIPRPDVIRSQLAQKLKEIDILKKLLRLSERAAHTHVRDSQ
jgi:hypothetical protein